jgi:hypothetical protein
MAEHGPHRKIEAEVWKCEDVLKAIRGTIDAHVKEVGLADRLEQALRAFYAYRATSKVVIFDEPASGK